MQELAKTLPFILGAAVSPVLLVTTLLVLSQKSKPVLKTIMLLVGATLTISIICLLVFYTTWLSAGQSKHSDFWGHLIIGGVLIVLATSIYMRGPAKPSSEAGGQKDKGILLYLLLGVGLMLTNFTTIAMVLAVALEIRDYDSAGISKVIYLVATILSSLFPILLPLIILALAGKHSAKILAWLSGFMKKYAHIIAALFFGALGIFSIFKAFMAS